LKRAVAIYRDAEDLINIGAYVKGSNNKIDYAIELIDKISGFVQQSTEDRFTFEEVLEMLYSVLEK
jgi:flagellum-specific ATP synthase